MQWRTKQNKFMPTDLDLKTAAFYLPIFLNIKNIKSIVVPVCVSDQEQIKHI